MTGRCYLQPIITNITNVCFDTIRYLGAKSDPDKSADCILVFASVYPNATGWLTENELKLKENKSNGLTPNCTLDIH